MPKEDDLLNEVGVALSQTGVVSGEFGFSDAYSKKKEQIQSWLQDKDGKVRDFAMKFQADLEIGIEHAKNRAKEDIALRKHQYGDDLSD